MSDLSKAYHDLAMGQCDLADQRIRESRWALKKALELEIEAAVLIPDDDPEANFRRGLYYRSAGSIAFPYPERHGAAVNILAGVH